MSSGIRHRIRTGLFSCFNLHLFHRPRDCQSRPRCQASGIHLQRGQFPDVALFGNNRPLLRFPGKRSIRSEPVAVDPGNKAPERRLHGGRLRRLRRTGFRSHCDCSRRDWHSAEVLPMGYAITPIQGFWTRFRLRAEFMARLQVPFIGRHLYREDSQVGSCLPILRILHRGK